MKPADDKLRGLIIDSILPLCLVCIGIEGIARNSFCILSYCIDFAFIGIFESYFFVLLGVIYFLIKRRKRKRREKMGDTEEEPVDQKQFF
jgi:hypothetical protein